LAAGQFDEAQPHFRDFLAACRKSIGSDHPNYAGVLAQVSLDLLRYGQPAAAEPLLRECLAIREKKQPDDWRTFNTRSMLGGALLSRRKYADAEPLLRAGYEGMTQREKSIPPQGQDRCRRRRIGWSSCIPPGVSPPKWRSGGPSGRSTRRNRLRRRE
jgi:eukaryotic-like serine/threonine-protein kinase